MWSQIELERAFERYRDRYWPGRLKNFKIAIGPTRTAGAFGECVSDEHLIIVDRARHSTQYELRSTLLHEMAHAAAGVRSRGHDSKFFEQLERLLECRVRMSMGLPETGNLPSLTAVPSRFPRCRRVLAKAYARQQTEIIEMTKGQEPFDIDDEYLSDEFYEAGMQGLTWRQALAYLGRTYVLTDIDGHLMETNEASVRLYKHAHREGRKCLRDLRRMKEMQQ